MGIADRECRLCFAWALWNGKDPILKERLYVTCTVVDEAFNSRPMAVKSISFGSPHVRPMGVHRTCGEPSEIKKKMAHHPLSFILRHDRLCLQGTG